MPSSKRPRIQKTPSQVIRHERLAKTLFFISLGLPLFFWSAKNTLEVNPFPEVFIPFSLGVAAFIWFGACYQVTCWLNLSPVNTLWGVGFIPGLLILLRKGDLASVDNAFRSNPQVEETPSYPAVSLSQAAPRPTTPTPMRPRHLEVLKNDQLTSPKEMFSEIIPADLSDSKPIIPKPRHMREGAPMRQVIQIPDAKKESPKPAPPARSILATDKKYRDQGLPG